eukprot:Rhum_TRINITY_DN15185_c4_g1::Rhum_TRINITY_DN15185_c4_g1_i1::g.142863::m.142863
MADVTTNKKPLRLGKYVLGRTLGEGASSKVKEAVNEETGEAVAIKLQKKGEPEELDARVEIEVMRTMREREESQRRMSYSTGSSCSSCSSASANDDRVSASPCSAESLAAADATDAAAAAAATPREIGFECLAGLVEVMESSKYLYTVLEVVQAGDLFAHAQKEVLNEEEARWVLHRVLLALAELHDAGIAHRDVKPENILVDFEQDVVKLADFGLARIHAESDGPSSDATYSVARVGTEEYAAPEVLVAAPRYNAYCADMWSLGATAHVCMLGTYPKRNGFDAAAPSARKLSAAAADVLGALLQPDPSLRPSAAELLFHPFFAEADDSDAVAVAEDVSKTLPL